MEENENINDDVNNLENEKNLENNIEEKEPRKIEVVTGDGDLTISPVYDHLEVEKPKPKENRTIIVPEVKDNVSRESEEEKDFNDEESNT